MEGPPWLLLWSALITSSLREEWRGCAADGLSRVPPKAFKGPIGSDVSSDSKGPGLPGVRGVQTILVCWAWLYQSKRKISQLLCIFTFWRQSLWSHEGCLFCRTCSFGDFQAPGRENAGLLHGVQSLTENEFPPIFFYHWRWLAKDKHGSRVSF